MANAVQSAEPNIDQKTLFEKLSFKAHSTGQNDYMYSTARFNIPCCGRRYGKSQAAGHRMTYKSFVPDSYNWIVGPTYKLAEKEFRVVFKDYEELGLLKYCKKSYNVTQGTMRIQTPWKSVVECVSAEKQDSLLGEGLSHCIMSEAAKHNRSTWEQYIEPALSDLLGTADFPSTPQGFNWYHGLWMLGQSAGAIDTYHPDYKSWRFPSWENVLRYPGGINNAEIQRIKSVSSKTWFDQEYGASFTAITGAIFEEWNDERHIQPIEFDPSLPNYLFFDYGWSNPFVALDVQIAPDETVRVWREYFRSYLSTYEHGQLLKLRDQPAGYRVDSMWGDPRGSDEAATLSLVFGQYVGFYDLPWKLGIEDMRRRLKSDPPKLIVDPSCVNLIREMPQLHIKPISRNSKVDLDEFTGQGNVQHKVDDHAVDALRYGIGAICVAGMGDNTLTDIYGTDYQNSESRDVFTSLAGASSMTLDDELSLRSQI